MQTERSSEHGFSLIEVMIASGVLAVGLLGAVAVLGAGMQKLGSAPTDVVAVQKAAEAIESVFSARDSHKLTWAQLRNVNGAYGNDGGVFLDGAKLLKLPGADGLVNTVDDGVIETVALPGVDQNLGTADDRVIVLSNYDREIIIRDVPNTPPGCGTGPDPCALRSVKVVVTYSDGKARRSYTLTTFISNYS